MVVPEDHVVLTRIFYVAEEYSPISVFSACSLIDAVFIDLYEFVSHSAIALVTVNSLTFLSPPLH